jgi:hypothetical protein
MKVTWSLNPTQIPRIGKRGVSNNKGNTMKNNENARNLRSSMEKAKSANIQKTDVLLMIANNTSTTDSAK